MKAYEYLTGPEKWTQGTFARDADGNMVSLQDPSAVCYCLGGLVVKFIPDVNERRLVFDRLTNLIQKTSHYTSPTAWNDVSRRTWEEVRDLLRRAEEGEPAAAVPTVP